MNKITLTNTLNPVSWSGDCLICPVGTRLVPKSLAEQLDYATSGQLSGLLQSKDFKAKIGDTLMLHGLPGLEVSRLLLVGTGSAKDPLSLLSWKKIFTSMFNKLQQFPIEKAALLLDCLADSTAPAEQLRLLAVCAEYSCYRYAETLQKKPPQPPLKKLSLVISQQPTAAEKKALQQGQAIGKGTNTARHLADLPANHCTPRFLADFATKMAADDRNLQVQVLDEQQLRDLKMHSMLSVSAGSAEPPRLIVIEHRGAAKKSAPPVVLVGKGVTFDTGGISLKPSAAMDEMKFDMCGAATVIGVLDFAATVQLPINLIGIVGAVENMPGSRATKPGDVVTSMSGLTIEVLNTDAEGRLVLCDALHYAQRFQPRYLIDIATLTGACVIALGSKASGLMGNNQQLIDDLLVAGQSTGDRAWQLPLWEEYLDNMKSNFADLANISSNREAGAITAGSFLSRFTDQQCWAHLDIAGTAWHSGKKKGATGRPVPLLSEFLLNCSQ